MYTVVESVLFVGCEETTDDVGSESDTAGALDDVSGAESCDELTWVCCDVVSELVYVDDVFVDELLVEDDLSVEESLFESKEDVTIEELGVESSVASPLHAPTNKANPTNAPKTINTVFFIVFLPFK